MGGGRAEGKGRGGGGGGRSGAHRIEEARGSE